MKETSRLNKQPLALQEEFWPIKNLGKSDSLRISARLLAQTLVSAIISRSCPFFTYQSCKLSSTVQIFTFILTCYRPVHSTYIIKVHALITLHSVRRKVLILFIISFAYPLRSVPIICCKNNYSDIYLTRGCINRLPSSFLTSIVLIH
jgi:hypothetical protein